MMYQRSTAFFQAVVLLAAPYWCAAKSPPVGFAYAQPGMEQATTSPPVYAPYNGAAFLRETPLAAMPGRDEDGQNLGLIVNRLMKKSAEDTAYVSPHVCDMGEEADEQKCLGKERGCMWTRMETVDAFKPIQEAKQICLPCTLDNENIPCWNPGAFVNEQVKVTGSIESFQVKECKMSCMHQERIWQPQYACTDTTGFISQSQCFDRGAKSSSKCMYIASKDEEGEVKGSCGPCEVSGSGWWSCPLKDAPGPEQGSKVIGCTSQCDVICSGPPACPPTIAPPPPPPPPSPGIVKVEGPADEMLSAPAPFLMPTPNPYAIAMAIQKAAEAAGWKVGTTPPPKIYWPVIYYRQPMDYMFTTGPPPGVGPEPPSGYAPSASAALLQSAVSTSMTSLDDAVSGAAQKKRSPFLRSLRRQSWGQ